MKLFDDFLSKFCALTKAPLLPIARHISSFLDLGACLLFSLLSCCTKKMKGASVVAVSASAVFLMTASSVYLSVFIFPSQLYLRNVSVFVMEETIQSALIPQNFNDDNEDILRQARIQAVCGNTNATTTKTLMTTEWRLICQAGLVQTLEDAMRQTSRRDVHIVQIGAHIGFEENDPICQGLATWIQALPTHTRDSTSASTKQRSLHWTFVEPSPPNFQRLQQNLHNQSAELVACDLRALNAAVVADDTPKMQDANSSNMTFYSLSADIDPATGYDARSGQTLPYFITQVSGLSPHPILYHARKFRKRGLNVHDYIVKTAVTAMRYTDLMHEIVHANTTTISSQPSIQNNHHHNHNSPILVLIDTEGLDCDILLNIAADSPYWANYLIYEHHQCGADKKAQTETYLASLGYSLTFLHTQNTLAVRNTTIHVHQKQ